MSFLPPSLPEGTEHYGVLARFDGVKELFHACEKVRDAGYSRWDAHTPFPVHGLDGAMGLKSSKLPWICLVTGLTGASAGMLMQWWVAVQAYPLIISCKPLFSWQAFVPVTFEVGVLFGALGAVLGMFAINQLPMLHHPLFNSKEFEQVTDDKFFISIESWDSKFDASQTSRFLEEIGAAHVELVPMEHES